MTGSCIHPVMSERGIEHVSAMRQPEEFVMPDSFFVDEGMKVQ